MYKFCAKKTGGYSLCGIKNIETDDRSFTSPLHMMTGAEITAARERLIGDMERIVLHRACQRLGTEACEALFVNARALNVENIAFGVRPECSVQTLHKLSRACGIRLLFETDEGFSFDEYSKLRCEDTGLIFCPREFVRRGERPFLDVLYKNKYKDDIVILRIEDCAFEKDGACLPEHGNAEVRECISALLARGFGGYFSVTPVDGELDGPVAELLRMLREM